MAASRFNSDELAAQALAGGGASDAGIRDFMNQPHRDFLAGLSYGLVCAVDAAGWPLGTLLTGAPGFLKAQGPTSLRIEAQPNPADPAADCLVPPRQIGLLGIDLATRRRNRINGRITHQDIDGITIAVDQAFGNCPQYIQRRTIESASGIDPLLAVNRTISSTFQISTPQPSSTLDDASRALIDRADTFFVASRSRAQPGASYGADMSHRGGRPGFVRIDGAGKVLTIPDFPGNRYFNTLGNLIAEPRASLLFIDFDNGNLLQIQGLATVDWDPAAAAQFPGAERLWQLRVERAWLRKKTSPIHWSLQE